MGPETTVGSFDLDVLKATIAWGNSDAVVALFASWSEADRGELAAFLIDEREQHWPLIRQVFGAEPPHHRERAAWRAGLAALFATLDIDNLLRLTETEHAYEEAYAPAVAAVLADRQPDWLLQWVDAALGHYPSGRLIALINGLQHDGKLDPIDLAPHIDAVLRALATIDLPDIESAQHLAAIAHRHHLGTEPMLVAADELLYSGPSENAAIWVLALRKAAAVLNSETPLTGLASFSGLKDNSLDTTEPSDGSPEPDEPIHIGVAPPPTPIRRLTAEAGPRPLPAGAVAIERRLTEQHATTSWHWQLAMALIETLGRHDHHAAQHHFEQAQTLSDAHPEVLAELAFFTDHVRKDKVIAERIYRQAIETGPQVAYKLYPPELTTMLRRTHYDQSATLAKYAGFLARERDNLSIAEQSLEQALFIRRRLGANPAAFEPDHIAFLRQLVVVANDEAPTSSLFGFDEWSGPSEMTFEL